jgi:isochorismate synthase EntC
MSNTDNEIRKILEEHHSIVTDELGEKLVQAIKAYTAQAENEARINEVEKLTHLNTTIHTPVGGISNIKWVEMHRIEHRLAELKEQTNE